MLREPAVVVSLIGAASVIVAAFVTGFFGLADGSGEDPPPTPEPVQATVPAGELDYASMNDNQLLRVCRDAHPTVRPVNITGDIEALWNDRFSINDVRLGDREFAGCLYAYAQYALDRGAVPCRPVPQAFLLT